MRRLLILFVVLPSIAASFAFWALKAQPPRAWRALMPTSSFKEPERDLKVLLLSQEYVRFWDTLLGSPYIYPSGGILWLVPKERLNSQTRLSGPGGWALAYAVDSQGKIFRFKLNSRGDRSLFFEPLVGPDAEKLEEYLRSAKIIAFEKEAFDSISPRIPVLAKRNQYMTYEEALALEADPKVSHLYETQLKPSLLLRLFCWAGIFFGIAFLISNWIATGSLLLRAALISLTVPISFLFMMWLSLSSHALGVSGIFLTPWVAFAVVLLLCSRIILTGKDETSFRRLFSLVSIIRQDGLPYLLVSLGVLSFLLLIPQRAVTTGDSMAIVWKTLYSYWEGDYALRALMERFGKDALDVHYPPGPALWITLLMGMIRPDMGKVFFPGEETGAIWLTYCTSLVWVHASLLLLTAAVVRDYVKRAWTLPALLFVLYFIPSSHGKIHACEALMWPFYGIAMVLTLLWGRREAPKGVGFLAALFWSSLFWFKNEGVIIAVLFGLPWMTFSFLEKREKWRPDWASVSAWIKLVVFWLPLLYWVYERKSLGITNKDFMPVSLSQLGVLLEKYRPLFADTFTITLGRGDVRWVEYGGLLILMSFIAFLHSLFYKRSWKDTFVFCSTVFYILFFPMIYLFSTWGDVWLHLYTSWGRLAVPAYLSLGMYLLKRLSYFEERSFTPSQS
jgi:hypothetical protein